MPGAWTYNGGTTYTGVGGTLDLATQAELDAHAADTTGQHGVSDFSALATTASVTSAVAAETAARAAAGKGYVEHGADADVARPTGFASVEWLGTVEPNNIDTDVDTWINPDEPSVLADGQVTSRYLSDLARSDGWLVDGAVVQSFERGAIGSNLALTSGVLALAGGCVAPGGRPIDGVRFLIGTTLSSNITNQWACVVDRDLNVLAKTEDRTTLAWTSAIAVDYTFATPWTPDDEIEVYAGIVVVASTMPSIRSRQGVLASNAMAPIIGGMSTTGLTNPASLGATATAPTASNQQAWAALLG